MKKSINILLLISLLGTSLFATTNNDINFTKLYIMYKQQIIKDQQRRKIVSDKIKKYIKKYMEDNLNDKYYIKIDNTKLYNNKMYIYYIDKNLIVENDIKDNTDNNYFYIYYNHFYNMLIIKTVDGRIYKITNPKNVTKKDLLSYYYFLKPTKQININF